MDQSSFLQEAQSVQKLLSEHSHKRCAQAPELVLLDQLVQVDAQQFKHQTEMLSMDEGILKTEDMVLIVFVVFGIQLRRGQ